MKSMAVKGMTQMLRKSPGETGFRSLCGKRNRPGDGMKLMRLLLSFKGGTETAGLAHREILNRGT